MTRQSFRTFLEDTSGSVFAYVALMMFTLVGFAGLAIDVGYWYSTQRTAQQAADAAAVAGAFEAMWGGDASAVANAARAQAEINGFDASVVLVNMPPLNGPNTGEANAVEVIVQKATPGFFTSIFYKSSIDVASRSVAGLVGGSPLCVLALKANGPGIFINSNSHLTANNCLVLANSSHSGAITTNSGSSVTAQTISVVGSTSGSGFSPSAETGADVIADPLSHLLPPSNASDPCDHNSTDYKSNQTIYPGVYCGDHVVDDNSTVTLSGGIYVFRGSKFEVNSGSTIKTNPGDGVTLFLASGHEFILNSDSTAELEAPATGELAGIVIYSVSSKNLMINSKSGSYLEGTVYVPNGKVMVNSNSAIGANANFSVFVADQFELNSSSTLTMNSDYVSSFVPAIPTLGAQRVALFE